jgi:tetracycline resistance efflux pump
MAFGILALVPPLVVILLAIYTKRSFEPLIVGCLVGYIMYGFLVPDAPNFFTQFVEALQGVLTNKNTGMVWIIFVCGFYGALIELIVKSGGAMAFGEYMLRYVKNRRSALIMTWFLGLFIFLDDYMSALTVGNTMKRITDKFNISREMLAFLVNTTAAPVCVIVPLSTWTIYSGKEIAKTLGKAETDWFWCFATTIPYMFYPWAVVILALLVALGWFPVIGKLKTYEAKAIQKGNLISNSSEKNSNTSTLLQNENNSPLDFLLPLFLLIAATVYFDIDALKGVIFTLTFTILYYYARKRLNYNDIFEGSLDGFKSMMLALAILTMSYVLKDVGDKMGLTQFVVESIKGKFSASVLPMIVFLAMAAISYATASSWGMYAIVLPLVVPVAIAQGANVSLTIAAVISAGAFGSHACMYSDATILTAASTDCDNVEHSLSQFPYTLIAVAMAAILFLLVGLG